MRKKSHISLAKYIVNDMQVPELVDHRKAFYIGSILPDCKPSFLTQKHEFSGTFDMVKDRIYDLTVDYQLAENNGRVYARRLGEVIHYLADYFTFPHNSTYDGDLKDHCLYEKDLKFRLREYVNSNEAFSERIQETKFSSVESIYEFVQKTHEEYLKKKRSVEEDCRFIVSVCHQVVQAILNLLQKKLNSGFLEQFSLATV